MRENTLYDGDSQFIWKDETVSTTMEMETSDTTISYFGFFSQATTEMVFEALGSPDAYIAYMAEAERPFFYLYMFYEEHGIVVNVLQTSFDGIHKDPDACEIAIIDEIVIREIFFLKPDSPSNMQNTLSTKFSQIDEPLQWRSKEQLELTTCRFLAP